MSVKANQRVPWQIVHLVGRRLRKLRESTGVEVSALAEQIGSSASYVRQCESPATGSGPSIVMVERIVRALVDARQVEGTLRAILDPEVRPDDVHDPEFPISPTVTFNDAERVLALQVQDLTARLGNVEYLVFILARALGGDIAERVERQLGGMGAGSPSRRSPMDSDWLGGMARDRRSLAQVAGSKARAVAQMAWATDPHRDRFAPPHHAAPHAVGPRVYGRQPAREDDAREESTAPASVTPPTLKLIRGGA